MEILHRLRSECHLGLYCKLPEIHLMSCPKQLSDHISVVEMDISVAEGFLNIRVFETTLRPFRNTASSVSKFTSFHRKGGSHEDATADVNLYDVTKTANERVHRFFSHRSFAEGLL
jgi:hypothetical protein